MLSGIITVYVKILVVKTVLQVRSIASLNHTEGIACAKVWNGKYRVIQEAQ